MAKEIKTAQQIRDEVQRLVNENREVREDGFPVQIALPYRHEPDERGCNWDIAIVSNVGGHERAVIDAIRQVRMRWLLRDDPLIA